MGMLTYQYGYVNIYLDVMVDLAGIGPAPRQPARANFWSYSILCANLLREPKLMPTLRALW